MTLVVGRLDLEIRAGSPAQIRITLRDADGDILPRADVSAIDWHLLREDGRGTPYREKSIGDGIEWDPAANAADAVALVTIQAADTEGLLLGGATSRAMWHCASAIVGGQTYPVVEGVLTLARSC